MFGRRVRRRRRPSCKQLSCSRDVRNQGSAAEVLWGRVNVRETLQKVGDAEAESLAKKMEEVGRQGK